MRGRELAPLRIIRYDHEKVVVVRWPEKASLGAPPKTQGHGSWAWRSGFPCKDGPQLLEYRVARALPIFLTRPLASSLPRIRIVLSFPKPASSDIWDLERVVPVPISV